MRTPPISVGFMYEIKKMQEENKLFFGKEYDLISQISKK